MSTPTVCRGPPRTSQRCAAASPEAAIVAAPASPTCSAVRIIGSPAPLNVTSEETSRDQPASGRIVFRSSSGLVMLPHGSFHHGDGLGLVPVGFAHHAADLAALAVDQ